MTRILKKGGRGSLVVSTKDGACFKSPQTILDKVLGKLTFDPNEYQKLAGYTDSLARSVSEAKNVVLGYYYSQTEPPVHGTVLSQGLSYSAYRNFENPQEFSRYPPPAMSLNRWP